MGRPCKEVPSLERPHMVEAEQQAMTDGVHPPLDHLEKAEGMVGGECSKGCPAYGKDDLEACDCGYGHIVLAERILRRGLGK